MSKPVKDTPCIGVCSTVYGDDVCRGCKRTLGQITDWNKADEALRVDIYGELNDSLLTACAEIIEITDVNLLLQKVRMHAVRMPRVATGESLAYYLLRAGSKNMQSLAKYGFKARPAYEDKSAWELFQLIDESWFAIRNQQQLSAKCVEQ